MKLVQGRIAHADTITTDDGVQIGVIYYSVTPLDDEFTKPEQLFREWWAEVTNEEEWEVEIIDGTEHWTKKEK